MNTAARTAAAVCSGAGYQNVVHTADARDWIPEADRNAGSENGVQAERMAAGLDGSDIHATGGLMGSLLRAPGARRGVERAAGWVCGEE